MVSKTTRDHDAARHGTPQTHLTAVQAHLVAASGEFVGTFFFLYFAYAGHLMAVRQQGSTSFVNAGTSSETIVFISMIYAFSLLVNVWAFYRISGGLFNPAVRGPSVSHLDPAPFPRPLS